MRSAPLCHSEAAWSNGSPVYARIRAHVEEAEAQALSILSANRALLEQMAKALLKTRDLDEVEASHWLAKVEMVAIRWAVSTPARTPISRVRAGYRRRASKCLKSCMRCSRQLPSNAE